MEAFERNYPIFDQWTRINNGSTFVIAVDVIDGFATSGALALKHGNTAVANMERVLKTLDGSKKVFVRDAHDSNSVEFKYFPSHCHTEQQRQIVKSLRPFVDTIVDKNSTNAIFKLLELDFKAAETVIVFGFVTDMCVLQAALSLRAYFNEYNTDKEVIVFSDCCDTFSQPADVMHAAALRIMSDQGIKIYKSV